MSEKTRYSDVELEEFKIIIEEKLTTAKSELEYYRDQLVGSGEDADAKVRGLDDGIQNANNERIAGLAARQQKLIKHLENALIRIENKVYGICRETGKLISKERLKAVPHATLSINAKNKK